MAGHPRRKTAAVDQDANVVTIPRLPPVSNADKPPGWDRWGAAEKVEHLLSMSLDCMREYLSWPPDDLDPYRFAAQTQVIREVPMVAAKVGVARRERTLAEMARRGSTPARHRTSYGENQSSRVGAREIGGAQESARHSRAAR